MAKSKQLTSKQQHFCRCVASGMSQSAAYREAYTCKPGSKPSTQQVAASLLMTDPMVSSRVDKLIKDRERGLMASTLSDKDKVLRKLRNVMDQNEGGPVVMAQLRAAELLGKSTGLFKDVQVSESPRTASEIQDELELRLAELGQLQDGNDPVEDIVPVNTKVH